MAHLNKDKVSKIFKKQLDQLGCPFTEDVEESWIKDLLFKPGEPRIRLLQWLFARFDPKLNDFLDPQYAPPYTKMDSRIQRLLFVASNLGFCETDDVDLIRGVTSASKQTSFMRQSIDFACIVNSTQDAQARAMVTPGIVSEGMDVHQQCASYRELMDRIAETTKTDQLFATHFKVLPPDIKKQLEKSTDIAEKDPQVPDIEPLIEAAEELEKQINKQNDILAELKQMCKFEAIDPQVSEKINKSLKLVLSENEQLVMGFSTCFETDLRHWCNREPPRLTQLGPMFKRVHGLLDKLITLLSSCQDIRASYQQMCTHLTEKLPQATQNIETNSLKPISCEQTSVNVLEESMLRLQQFDSHTHSTLNSTVNISLPSLSQNYDVNSQF